MTFNNFKTIIFSFLEDNIFYSEEEFSIDESVLKIEHDDYENRVAQGNDPQDMIEMSYQRIEHKLLPAL